MVVSAEIETIVLLLISIFIYVACYFLLTCSFLLCHLCHLTKYCSELLNKLFTANSSTISFDCSLICRVFYSICCYFLSHIRRIWYLSDAWISSILCSGFFIYSIVAMWVSKTFVSMTKFSLSKGIQRMDPVSRLIASLNVCWCCSVHLMNVRWFTLRLFIVFSIIWYTGFVNKP